MNIKNDFKPAKITLEKKLGRLTLGKLLRAIRLGEDETQDIFSDKLNMSKQQLSDIENNRKSVSPKAAAEYAKKLGYSQEQFIKLALQDGLARNGLFYEVDLVRISAESRTDVRGAGV
jgi:transcriptional regulator with XRE-family HTH domain